VGRVALDWLVFALALVEVPLFLARRRELFRNDLLYPFWHWSLGHTVAGIDFAARLHHPHRISVVHVPHPGSNAYVPKCFENVDAFQLSSLLTPRPGQLDRRRIAVLRWWLHLVAAFRSRLHVLERDAIYSSVSLAGRRMAVPNASGTALESGLDWTGYVRLLRDAIGRQASLPAGHVERCASAIEARYPLFFERPFVTLLLRTKEPGGPLHTDFRNSGPPEGYRPAVQWLCDNGFNVVGTGETPHSVFADIDGFYNFRDVDVSAELLSVLLLSRAALFIGQQSGGHVLPNAAGVPCLIVDAMPHRLGTFSELDLIEFKPLIDRSGLELSLDEVFAGKLAYGLGFEEEGVEIGNCSPETILSATQEAVASILGGVADTDEHERLLAHFRSLVRPDMPLCYSRTRPTLRSLRRSSALARPPETSAR
jgi:putative glycosyltransferase (TIGR04372 family)